MKRIVCLFSFCVLVNASNAFSPINRFDAPRWPSLNTEYLNLPLSSGEWDWALNGFERMPEFSVSQIDGYGACFRYDGKPWLPLWGWVLAHNRVDRQPKMGFECDLMTAFIRPAKWWPSDGVFNAEAIDRVAEQYFRVHPHAYLMWEVYLAPPADWAAKHPDELCRNELGGTNRCYVNWDNFSFSSKLAADEMERMVKRFIRHVETSPYARRVAGYRINSGTTQEWVHWRPSPDSNRVLDYSNVAQRGFAEFVRMRHPEIDDVSLPTKKERSAWDGDNLLWEPKRHQKVALWHEYQSETVASLLIRMCSAAKAELANMRRRKLVGTYYGYVVTMPGNGRTQQDGHYALGKVIDSHAVDFLISPPEYTTRGPGVAHIDMKPFASLKANGIVSVVEHDLRTANAPFLPRSACAQAPTRALSLAYIRRNLAVSACRNEPLSLFDICSGYAYDFPEARRDIMLIREAARFCAERQVPRNAEIAVVFSENAVKVLSENDRKITAPVQPYQSYDNKDGSVRLNRINGPVPWYETHLWGNARWGQVGAGVDYLLAEDLASNPGNYKVYAFPNAWLHDEGLAKAVARLRSRGCTLLWFYAPGYVSMSGNSTSTMKNLTGMKMVKMDAPVAPDIVLSDGRTMTGLGCPPVTPLFAVVDGNAEVLGTYGNGMCAVARKRTGNATDVFCGTWRPDAEFIFDEVRRSGVHVFSKTGDPLEANSCFVTLHARNPGRKTIRLPNKCKDVFDVFGGRVVATDTDSFTFDAELHATYLFYYGSDAKELMSRLKDVRKQTKGEKTW